MSCLLALLVIAGCGRIGYERVQLGQGPADGLADAADAAADRAVVDVLVVDAAEADAGVIADVPPDLAPDVSHIIAATPSYGREVGTRFMDLCPDGEVLIGFDGAAEASSGGVYSELVGRCGPVMLTSGAPVSVAPIPYRSQLPARGSGAITFGTQCPDRQVVVGFEGRAGPDLRALSFICADLTVSGGPATFLVAPGNDRHVEPLMNVAGGTPFAAACWPGTLARGVHLWAGPAIQAFGLVCETVFVRR